MSDSNGLHEAVERLLLEAGRAGAPPGSKERSLSALSSGLGVALVSSHAAARGAVASAGGIAGTAKAGSLTMLHLFLVTGLTGVGAVAGAMLVGDGGRVAPAISSGAIISSGIPAKPRRSGPLQPDFSVPATAASTVVPEPGSAEESHSDVPPPASSPVAASPTAMTPTGRPLREEIAMLDEARRAISLGEPARALSILDAYVTRFPHGAMAPEAALVRIEALLKAGDRSAAERAAAALTASDPDNPYVSRVHSLLDSSNR